MASAVGEAVKEVVEHPLGKAAALAIDVMFPGLPVGTALATVAEMTGEALDKLTDEDIDAFQKQRLEEQRAKAP